MGEDKNHIGRTEEGSIEKSFKKVNPQLSEQNVNILGINWLFKKYLYKLII